jgi:anti-anti-sigma regulatory factor
MGTRTGHRCWPFRTDSAVGAFARHYLAAALERGERAIYARPGPPARHRGELGDLAPAWPGGALQVLDTAELPGPDPSRDPSQWLEGLEHLARRARSDGFRGLRLFAELTDRVADERERSRYAHYEHLLGRLTLSEPVGLLCAYDLDRLGTAAVAELAAVHDTGGETLCPFQLTPAQHDGELKLSGSIDAFNVAAFSRALAQVDASEPPTLVIDASGLDFLCHQALIALHRHARTRGCTIRLRDCPGVVGRMIAILQLDRVEVECAAQ